MYELSPNLRLRLSDRDGHQYRGHDCFGWADDSKFWPLLPTGPAPMWPVSVLTPYS